MAVVTVEAKCPNSCPSFKKDAVSGFAAIKEAFTLCNDCNSPQITGSRITRIQAEGGGEFNSQKLKELCFEKNIVLSFSPSHQPSSKGIAERMVGMLKTTVSRLLTQAHLERQWWSYACKVARHMMRDKILGRTWTWPLFGQLVGIWKGRDKRSGESTK